MNSTLYSTLIRGEINVVLASDAMSATDSAADLVKAFNAEDLRVYSVNTVYNLRVLNAILRKRLGPDYPIDDRRNKLYYFSSSQHGDLGRAKSLQYDVGWDSYDVVIVTTWELAARAYRYREALIYDLTELSRRGVTVVVYSTASTEPKAGRADRAGIGKLGLVSTNIVSIAKHYHSNIGLTLEDIRQAARQAWPEAYEEYVAQQERKKREKEAVEAAGLSEVRRDGRSEIRENADVRAFGRSDVREDAGGRAVGRSDVREEGVLTNDQRLTTNDSQSAQLSDRKINELGALQPGLGGEEWEALFKTSGDASLALRMTADQATH